jgi:dephospho-CoA kinase
VSGLVQKGLVLGLSGKACAGKDAVATLLAGQGWLVIDGDKIGQEALVAKESLIASAFMEDDIFDLAGRIERKKLGKVVFSSKVKLQRLNSISHPYVVERIHQIIAEQQQQDKTQSIVVNAAMLPTVEVSGLDAMIFVRAKLRLRVLRALARDKRSIGFVLKRIWAQRALRPQLFWQNVDIYYIDNNQTSVELALALTQMLATTKGRHG